MKTVHEVSELSGVSVRTLHHYDAIGLLPPTKITEAGYRLYDESALRRLQTILMFRELQFPLKEIKHILESPDFDEKEALRQQIKMLELQREHLGELVSFARQMIQNGGNTMDFQAFDQSELEAYQQEVKTRWGNTPEYREYSEKHAGESTGKEAELMAIFGEFGAVKATDPADKEAQALVTKLRAYISANFYECSKEILFSLGQMYVGDERMKQNIDRAGGEGTAAFAEAAIAVYCGKE